MRRAGISLALTAMLATFGASQSGSAQELKPWRHSLVPPKSDAGILMMAGEGFATRQGLKLEYVPLQGDPIGYRALLNGEVDTHESTAAGAIVAPGHGAEVKIVGCHLPALVQGIFVADSIGSVQDLKGKIFAVSLPGALPEALARALLEKSNIKPSEVQFANLGTDTDRFKALVAGKVDAAVVSTEFKPVADDPKLKVKMLVTGRDMLPNYMRQCIVTTAKIIATRRDDLVRFVAAEIAGLRYAVAHRDAALKLTARIIDAKPGDPRLGYIFDDMVANHAIDPELAIPMDKLAWMEDQALALGDLKTRIDLATIIDPTIRQQALALLGK
jgi:NitT/TauT family transport system substrate-binding protein